MRVLIVEDDDNLRMDIAEILELENHEAITAANGQEGLEKTIETQPDLIFCDMNMPIMDGHDMLLAVRNNPTIADIPIIILTGNSTPGVWEKLKAAGANDWLSKPFAHTDLLAIIDSYRPKFTD